MDRHWPKDPSEDATGRWGLPRTMGWATGVDEAQIVDDGEPEPADRLRFRPLGGYRKIPSGGHITRGICDVPSRRDFPEIGCGRRTLQMHIARRGELFR